MLPNRCHQLNKFACNPYKYWILLVCFITRTLFSFPSKPYISLLFLFKTHHFVSFISLFYMVSNLLYPICTQPLISLLIPVVLFYLQSLKTTFLQGTVAFVCSYHLIFSISFKGNISCPLYFTISCLFKNCLNTFFCFSFYFCRIKNLIIRQMTNVKRNTIAYFRLLKIKYHSSRINML